MAVSSVYGKPGVKLSPTLAAFTNGVAVRLGLPGGSVLLAFPGDLCSRLSQGNLCSWHF